VTRGYRAELHRERGHQGINPGNQHCLCLCWILRHMSREIPQSWDKRGHMLHLWAECGSAGTPGRTHASTKTSLNLDPSPWSFRTNLKRTTPAISSWNASQRKTQNLDTSNQQICQGAETCDPKLGKKPKKQK
jgi:hypothetical protein